VVADGGLTEAERLGQVADASLVAGLRLDEAQEPQAGGIGDGLEDRGELLGVLPVERLLQERGARSGDGRDRLHALILTDIDGLVIIAASKESISVDIAKEAGMPQAIDPVTQHHIDQAAARLAEEFEGVFSRETIARYMTESQDLLGDARINVFVPVLAHRFARERLKALAQAEGKLTKEQPEVLFVCTHNAGRSQMAAGLVRLRSQGRIHVRSAGSTPADEINPAAVEAMQEVGVDMSEAFPKPLTDEVVRAADVVITMGCGDACPIFPGKRYEDWDLEDPAGKDVETVRRIRDDLDLRVQALIAELLPN
jgi:arsenate reductase (thioredoxin)